MPMPYIAFVRDSLHSAAVGEPIYAKHIAEKMADVYGLPKKKAAEAVAVAVKRIRDGGVMPDLRRFQKGIYYRTAATPFGEIGINKEQLVADKYLLPDRGYETGPAVLHHMGLASQMPRERILATNMAKGCVRTDKRLGVTIRPPKITVTAKNKIYLQTLDVLEALDHVPVDAENPYALIADDIRAQGLQYGTLLALADKYYNKSTVLRLAHTASAGRQQ